MTQPDTVWQEPWWVCRGTVSPDRGTVHLLWSGAALVACIAEAWLLNQICFLITVAFSSFLLPLPLDTWAHSGRMPEPVGVSLGFSLFNFVAFFPCSQWVGAGAVPLLWGGHEGF